MGIRSASDAANKWQKNASAASGDYASGIRNPRRDWAQATAEANEAYVQGVTQAAQAGRFASGVQNAGTQKQQNNAINKGVPRYGQGVSVAKPTYQQAIQPVLEIQNSLTMSPRGPKGSPQNITRVAEQAAAQHAAKLAR